MASSWRARAHLIGFAALLFLSGCDTGRVVITNTFNDVTAPSIARRGDVVRVQLTTSAPDGCYTGGYAAAAAMLDPKTSLVTFQGRSEPRRHPFWSGDYGCSLMPVLVQMDAAFVPPAAGRYNLEIQIKPIPGTTSARVLEMLGLSTSPTPQPPFPQGPLKLTWPLDVTE